MPYFRDSSVEGVGSVDSAVLTISPRLHSFHKQKNTSPLKGAVSRLNALKNQFSLNFSILLFVIRVNLLHP